MHFIKSRVDQVVKHLVYLSRPGTARVHTGFQVKPRDLEGPEDRTLGGDPHQVTTNGLNPEPELLSRQQVNEAAAHDPDQNVRLTMTELLGHLENQDVPADSFSAPTQDMVTGELDLSDGVTEEPQDHPCSMPVQMLTKREKNRLKSLRKKQRKKERWIQRQLEEKVVVYVL